MSRFDLAPGTEHLTAARDRTGFSHETFRRVLERAGTPITVVPPKPPAHRSRFIVNAADVDAAVAAWLKTETINGAAKARRVSTGYLLKALTLFGKDLPPRTRGCAWRVPTETIDAALAALRGERAA